MRPRDDDQLAAGIVAAARQAVRAEKRRRRAPSVPRAVGYVRVSTEEQGDQGAGIEAQRQAITAACTGRRWELIAIEEDVASGSSFDRRPGLERALRTIHRGEASTLVVAKLDRLSRSVVDAAQLIERARREGWNLVALDLGVDFSTAAGEAMANMTAVFAQLERRLIGERTRAALAVKKAQGVRLGRPPLVAEQLRVRLVAERRAGDGWTMIADRLTAERTPTVHGGRRWYPATVCAVVLAAEPRLARKLRR